MVAFKSSPSLLCVGFILLLAPNGVRAMRENLGLSTLDGEVIEDTDVHTGVVANHSRLFPFHIAGSLIPSALLQDVPNEHTKLDAEFQAELRKGIEKAGDGACMTNGLYAGYGCALEGPDGLPICKCKWWPLYTCHKPELSTIDPPAVAAEKSHSSIAGMCVLNWFVCISCALLLFGCFTALCSCRRASSADAFESAHSYDFKVDSPSDVLRKARERAREAGLSEQDLAALTNQPRTADNKQPADRSEKRLSLDSQCDLESMFQKKSRKATSKAAAFVVESGEEHLDKHKRVREKNDKERAIIRAGVHEDRVCAVFQEPEIEAILDAMEYFEFDPGEHIVEQGRVGTSFFVVHEGSFEVIVNGHVCNTLSSGMAFGGIALLYGCPRTATVKAVGRCSVWGANCDTFQRVLRESMQRTYAENRKFLESLVLFDGLQPRQKDRVTEVVFNEMVHKGVRVATEGEVATGIYFVKKGELQVCSGGTVICSGELIDGKEIGHHKPGDCFGFNSMHTNETWDSTVIAQSDCELLSLRNEDLQDALGGDLAMCLERNFIMQALSKSPVLSKLSQSGQQQVMKAMTTRNYEPNEQIGEGLQFIAVIQGSVTGVGKDGAHVDLRPGDPWEEGLTTFMSRTLSDGRAMTHGGNVLQDFRGGESGARIKALTAEGHAKAMEDLGLSRRASLQQAEDYLRKVGSVKKVPIFRHLSQEQIRNLVMAFALERFEKGDNVITQGEPGSSFYVVAKGEVTIMINGNVVRTMGKNAYFGERALLFDEPRTATVCVSSIGADLWSVEKSTFSEVVRGNMREEVMNRIRLQNTSVDLKDLLRFQAIGTGMAGVVWLVQHKKTKTRYALKRVKKMDGQMPEVIDRECRLLAENDHPFIMNLVKTFEREKFVYILQELITGGDLHAAISSMPTCCTRKQAQFYIGSLVIVLEELSDRNIIYRDLKPENVMLDQQGYLKLIDFGIAKKLDDGVSRTFSKIGTPHYMAPEIIRGRGYGIEADLWSLGVVLFELVCGQLPFADEIEDPALVCKAVLKDHLDFPPEYRDLPGIALMKGLLCRPPAKRLGAGVLHYQDVRSAEFFKDDDSTVSMFDRIMGRELVPPVVPTEETYGDPEEMQLSPSDQEDFV